METILTKYKASDGTEIYVEAAKKQNAPKSGRIPAGGGMDRAAESIKDASESFSDSLKSVKSVIGDVYNQLNSIEIKPDEIEVELNFKMNAEFGAVLTTIGGEASIGVKLKWDNLKDKK